MKKPIQTKHATSFIFFEEKLLLLLRDNNPNIPNPNKWQLIGGHVDEGEDYDTAVRREIKEETCMMPENIKYLATKEIPGDKEIGIFAVYLTKDDVNTMKLGNEGQQLSFFSIDELNKIQLSKGLAKYLDVFSQELKQLSKGENISLDKILNLRV